jgi:hypothetical protein
MSIDFHRLSLAAASLTCRCMMLMVIGVLATPFASAAEAVCDRPMLDAMPLLEKMERSWSEVSDYTAVLLKTERSVDGAITEERGFIKFRKPGQLYLHLLEGSNAGAELLFPKPGTDSVVLGRPGGVSGAVAGFLINVPAIGRLIPYEFDVEDGRLMTGQHHPLPDSTLTGMMDLISVNLRAANRHLEGSMCFHANEIVDGKPAMKLEVRLPSDVGIWHTAVVGETLWTIAEDYKQDRYVILYNNPSVEPEKRLTVGDRVFVPRYYAPRALIWISQSLHLPLKLQMFDTEKKLYEAYSNVDLRIDVGLTDEDFDPVLHGFPVVTTSGEDASRFDATSR